MKGRCIDVNNHIDIDLYKTQAGDICFRIQQLTLPPMGHNPMLPQALADITAVCAKYNVNGFTLYLDPITEETPLDDD